MDHKRCVQLAIIGHPEVLDYVLEAYDVCDGFLGVPDVVLVSRNTAFFGDLETASIDRHL